MSNNRERIVIVLAPEEGVRLDLALRRLLKRLGRAYSLKCLGVVTAPSVGEPLVLPDWCCNGSAEPSKPAQPAHTQADEVLCNKNISAEQS